MNPTVKEIIDLIQSPALQEELFPIKIVFIFFSVFFFVVVIYLMFKSSYLRHQLFVDFGAFFAWQPVSLQKVIRRWKAIEKRMGIGTEHEYKLAIIEADNLLKEILEEKGFKGKTLEERIKQVEEIQLPNLNEVLEAHKIRNSIVYDPNYKLDADRAKQILGVYEQGIKNIESF